MAVNGVRHIRSEKGSGFRSPVIRLSVRNVKDVLWIKILVLYISFRLHAAESPCGWWMANRLQYPMVSLHFLYLEPVMVSAA